MKHDKVHSAHNARSEPRERFESGESEEQLADAILELRVEAEEIEAAVWTNVTLLGSDNVWVFKVNQQLKRCLTENMARIAELENESRKRKEKERGKDD